MDLKLPELTELERIIQAGAPWLEARSACNVEFKGRHFPVYVLSIGSKDPAAPAVGFFGGVHGLERIGTRILLAFLRSLIGRLKWDKVLHHQLESVRLIFMPLVNPAGMWNNTRCNTSGVDLMRNAPVDSLEKVPFLLGGQRFSARLPWYRGAADAPMEPEAQALCDVVREELSSRAFSVALDCHSGFGLQDRIWFPFAHSSQPIRHMPQIEALKDLFSQTYADHNYLFEPQSLQYLTHGDLWDYLYLQTAAETNNVFLPLTLEMGSWRWVKKNPRQLFSRTGMFNPNAPHRLQRVLRSHLVWFDFLTRAACAHKHWLPGEDGSTPIRVTGA
ncbi:DUF2817 domain-containing protein [Herbaspirillum rhizosphaerae]|uniref:DUF2817 domain-containing protein n=1 Tax=Herbaspirillum rhizosphaerae TaxID=346179 RepID=A0ABW8Z987_9BURK